jgi:hypothetical protein
LPRGQHEYGALGAEAEAEARLPQLVVTPQQWMAEPVTVESQPRVQVRDRHGHGVDTGEERELTHVPILPR